MGPKSLRQLVSNRLNGLRALAPFDNALALIVDRTFFRSEVLIYQFRGCAIVVDHAGGDANGIRACLATDMYRQFLKHIRIPGPLSVLDLGANAGGFPLLLTTEHIPVAALVCVEMNPNVFRRLQFNVERNVSARKTLINAAVSNRPGLVSQQFGRGDTGESLDLDGIQESDDVQGGQGIPAVTVGSLIDEYFPGGVDICKVDIEGTEWVIADGAFQRCRYVIIEIHRKGGADPQSLVRRLESGGLEFLSKDSRDPVYLFRQAGMAQ